MRDVGAAVWRQRPLVALIILVTGVAVALGLLVAPKTYAATATTSAASSPTATEAPAELQAIRSTLAELANSRAVAEEARRRLRADRDADGLRRSVEGHWVQGTILVDVTAEDRDPGTAPDSFTSPDRRLAIGLGVLLALGLAVVAAVARDRRTHTVNDAAGVEQAATAPLLAHLAPPVDLTEMPALAPGTAEADLFRHLRRSLEIQGAEGSPRAVVAGVSSGDVNVWIGANVAIALAGIGRRVLLVDGRMGERFGVPVQEAPNTPGLYDVLMGADLDSAVSPGPVDLLQVLPSGTWGDEPVADLIARRFDEVMEEAAVDFEHVVVLGPPLEVCDDSRLMAAEAAMVIALIAGATSATAMRAHADRVRAAGATLLGVVLVGRQPEGVA